MFRNLNKISLLHCGYTARLTATLLYRASCPPYERRAVDSRGLIWFCSLLYLSAGSCAKSAFHGNSFFINFIFHFLTRPIPSTGRRSIYTYKGKKKRGQTCLWWQGEGWLMNTNKRWTFSSPYVIASIRTDRPLDLEAIGAFVGACEAELYTWRFSP